MAQSKRVEKEATKCSPVLTDWKVVSSQSLRARAPRHLSNGLQELDRRLVVRAVRWRLSGPPFQRDVSAETYQTRRRSQANSRRRLAS